QAQMRTHKSLIAKQQETAAKLQRAFSEREEDCKYTEQLLMELKNYQSELMAAEEQQAQYPIEPDAHALLCSQLEAARSELRAEEAANATLTAELAEAEAASARRDELLFERNLEERHRQCQRQLDGYEVAQPDLVTFNVSGKIYTVLREPTLSLHPNSLLKQLADEKQNEKEIFVEGMGDQDLFKYVLEYHRDRKVILPPTVSKELIEAVLRELNRFGLDIESDKRLGCVVFRNMKIV
ncbi:unnamed protein product, partial [Symbiodinium pilosum]